MSRFPCRCASGHKFSRVEAERLGLRCDVDGTVITCKDGRPARPVGPEGAEPVRIDPPPDPGPPEDDTTV